MDVLKLPMTHLKTAGYTEKKCKNIIDRVLRALQLF